MNNIYAHIEFCRVMLCRHFPVVALVAMAISGTSSIHAQGFAAIVSPPRFELSAKAGDKLRQIVEITNASAQSAKFYLKTGDWTLDKTGGVVFDENLQAGSCRPWVAIEKREIIVSGGGKYQIGRAHV